MVNLSKHSSNHHISLPEYLDHLQLQGRHFFLSSDLEKTLEIKKSSTSSSLSKLAKQKRLKMIKRGFGILLDVNGREPDPTSYIDALMKHVGSNYYVGLLSAASYWGASHQASMSYQVFTEKNTKNISFERGRVEFINRRYLKFEKWVKRVATTKGYFRVSTPELTAIDLISFPEKCGYLNNVATVLSELVESWNGKTITALCSSQDVPTVVLQRLGYILDEVLAFKKHSSYIEKALKQKYPSKATLSKLLEDKKASDYVFNEKWMLYINTEVEAD